jgi:hypothetical protein
MSNTQTQRWPSLHKERGEVGIAMVITESELAIKDDGFRRELCHCRGDRRVGVREVVSVLAEESDVLTVLMDLDTIPNLTSWHHRVPSLLLGSGISRTWC